MSRKISDLLFLILPLLAVLLLTSAPRSSSGYVMARILAPPDTTVLETSESAALGLSQPEEINGAGGGDDEEPETATFVLSKKSATALNKLMIALRSFDKGSGERGPGLDVGEAARLSPVMDTFSLQRRNQKDRKTYLRCYFNAVSCF